jgi:hypothetical protein
VTSLRIQTTDNTALFEQKIAGRCLKMDRLSGSGLIAPLVESFDDFDESSLLFNLALLRAGGKLALSCHKGLAHKLLDDTQLDRTYCRSKA